MPELAVFDLKIGFLVKNYVYFTPGMYGKPPKIRFDHGFSKAGFGHASLFLKKTCIRDPYKDPCKGPDGTDGTDGPM